MTITKTRHDCKDGFRGFIIKRHGATFCNFCGAEFQFLKKGT